MLRDRVGFLKFPILKWGSIFAPVGIVFPVLSLERAPKLYQVQFQSVNYHFNEKQKCFTRLPVHVILIFVLPLNRFVPNRVWVLVAHTFSKFKEVPPPPLAPSV